MRTLPAPLITAVSAAGQQPTLTITAQDLQTRFSQLATGGVAGPASYLITASGTILVAINSGSQILVFRITNPATASQWNSGSISVTVNALQTPGNSLVRSGTTIRCFFIDGASHLVYAQSTDDGVTWSANTATNGALPLGTGNFCYGIAADSNTSVWTMWASYDPNGPYSGFRTKNTGAWTAWAAEGPATPPQGIGRGVSFGGQIGANRAYAAGISTFPYVKGVAATAFLWNGATYSSVAEVQKLDNATLGVQLAATLSLDAGNTWWLTALWKDDGTVSGTAGTRCTIFTSPDFVTWSPYGQLGSVFTNQAITLNISGTLYIFDGNTVYTAPVGPTVLDLSDDVLTLDIHESPNAPAQLTLTIVNTAGTYTNHPDIRSDATIKITLGYGANSVQTHAFTIDSYSFVSAANENTVIIHGRDHARLLEYPSSRFLAYSGQTIAAIATDIARQAGATLATLPATPQFSQTVPCFQIVPGETWASAFDKLSTLYSFDWFVQVGSGTGQIKVVETNNADASVWDYGPEILAASYTINADQANVIRIVGVSPAIPATTIFSEALDSPNLATVGKERWRQVVERMIDTSAKAKIKAALILKEEQQLASAGTIEAALHPGLELLDVITLTDANLGLSLQRMRVDGLHLQIDPESMTWTHHISLQAP